MTIIFLVDCLNESLYFVLLLFAAVTKTYQINSNSILFQFLGKYFESVHILDNGGGYEANNSLLLCLVRPMFQSKWANLQSLYKKCCTWVKCNSPCIFTPNKYEFTFVESLVIVHKISTCFPPISPRPTDDWIFDYNLDWISKPAESTWLSHLVGK